MATQSEYKIHMYSDWEHILPIYTAPSLLSTLLASLVSISPELYVNIVVSIEIATANY